ncbi:MAG TPA: response regulator transcription factor [Puia sp.]|nr:response regulator transcription factor [Puia sp.]
MTSIAVSIIEDIADIRIGLERIINASPGFLLLSSYDNAEAAVKGLPEARPDIVIADIQLPGMSGIDCVRRVRAGCPQIQFMMFTIYEDSEQIFEALEAGASGYLLKQTHPDSILDAIRELYHGGAPMSAGIARRVVNSFRDKPKPGNVDGLTERENEILQLLAKGLLYKEIGRRLDISTETVRQHIHRIYGKLQVQNKTEAINKAFGR